MSIKHFLNRKMKTVKLRHTEAAKVLDVPRSTLSRWLSGYTVMPTKAEEQLEILLRFRELQTSKQNEGIEICRY